MDRNDPELSVKTQARLLGVNRSGLYYRSRRPSDRDLELKRLIDEVYTAHPSFGSRRITAWLRRDSWSINRKAVQRHMREMGLAGIHPGPNLSKRNLQHKVYPYLLRGLKIERPNQVWGVDITYIRLAHGWMYLVVVLDWHSRFVVSWDLEQGLEIGFVLRAMRRALGKATPEICNSDQGSHFTSDQYLDLLKEAGVRISMDGRDRALDNVFTERFWRTLKYEEVYLHEYESPREARRKIAQFIDFYNWERPHQALGYRTPAEVYGAARADRNPIPLPTPHAERRSIHLSTLENVS